MNAEIKYGIQKGAMDAFAIHNLSGVVTVTSALDFDKRNTYRIQIIASDLGENVKKITDISHTENKSLRVSGTK
jgi:hypothetical protein